MARRGAEALRSGGPEAAVNAAWQRAIEPGRGDGRLVAESADEARPARLAPIPRSLDPGLTESLRASGIEALYSHQVEALEAAVDGNVIVTSGTASGKSLCFNLPVLDGLARDSRRRALYLYPTKALAQDQARALSTLDPPGLRHAIYDGDTPRDDRPGIRRRSNLVLTNPDMLNVGILPHHKRWGDFLGNLGWVVVDEAHAYRGVFGSHVANVLRRLRRVARLHGARPRFLLASATIANPLELAERLCGEPFTLVDSDGAPRAARRIAMWNPPLIDERSGTRRSALSEGADLLAALVTEGLRTICFLNSRRGIELIQRFVRERLREEDRGELGELIAPYRAGYTPQQRRGIEAALAAGELLAVVATDALELGIDVGELDAAMCVTFPGTVASLRQMWGRAAAPRGRTRSTSSSAATRRSSSAAPSRPPSSTTRASRSSSSTWSRRHSRRRWGEGSRAFWARRSRARPTTSCSVRGGASAPTSWSGSASCGAGGAVATWCGARAFRPAGSRCARPRRTRWP